MNDLNREQQKLDAILQEIGRSEVPRDVEAALRSHLEKLKRGFEDTNPDRQENQIIKVALSHRFLTRGWRAAALFAVSGIVLALVIFTGNRASGVAFVDVLEQIRTASGFAIASSYQFGADSPLTDEEKRQKRDEIAQLSDRETLTEKLRTLRDGSEEYLGVREINGRRDLGLEFGIQD